jgi:protein TonB
MQRLPFALGHPHAGGVAALLREPMLAATTAAIAAHLLVLLGIGFRLPEPAPPAPRTLEVMTVEQPSPAPVSPARDAVRAQMDRAGETSVPLPELASGTAVDAPEPTEPTDAPDVADAQSTEPPVSSTQRTAPQSDADEPAPASPARQTGPEAAGAQAAVGALSKPLLDTKTTALAEILTGLGSNVSLPDMPSAAPPPASAPEASATDVFASRGVEIAALTARINARNADQAGRARRKAISTNTKEYRYASYMEAWRRKVERIGNLNYPKEARELGLFGSLILHVAVRADGELEGVRVVRSSGHDVLDQAAVRIVRLAAPFAPFPNDIAAETDVLDITRVWQFQRNNRLGWD